MVHDVPREEGFEPRSWRPERLVEFPDEEVVVLCRDGRDRSSEDSRCSSMSVVRVVPRPVVVIVDLR